MVRGSYIKHREIDKIHPVLAFGKKMNDEYDAEKDKILFVLVGRK